MKTAAQFKAQLDRISKLADGLAEDPVAEFHELVPQARALFDKLRDIEQRLRDRSDEQGVLADQLDNAAGSLDAAADYLEGMEASEDDDE